LDFGSAIADRLNPKSKMRDPKSLLVLSVQRMAPTATAEFFEFEPVRLVLFVLGRHVITLFALGALQNNVVPRHLLTLYCSLIVDR
jgi:hypothetical protein